MKRRTFVAATTSAVLSAAVTPSKATSVKDSLTGSLPPSEQQKLFDLAHQAKANAYDKYSDFQVGAAVLANDGTVITGCNVENASYSLSICAERAAIFKAVSMGYKPGDIAAIAVAANVQGFSPCGACRQVLAEFGEKIDVIFEYDNKIVAKSVHELLPYRFKL